MSTHKKPAEFSVANASWVTDQLAVGGDLDYDDDLAISQAQELAAAGITHILDLRNEWSDEQLVQRVAPSITYLHYGVADSGQRIPGEWFDYVVGFCNDALKNPQAKVFVHCHMGINRGPSAGFAVMLAQGWDVVDALNAIREARPVAAILYSTSALEWHMAKKGITGFKRMSEYRRLARWHREHPHDTATMIERIRRQEARHVNELQLRNASIRLLSDEEQQQESYHVATDAHVYFLTWNAERVPVLEWLNEAIGPTELGQRVQQRWQVATSHPFITGDRVFLLRQGAQPRGIVASGFLTADGVEEVRASKKGGKTKRYVQVSWDVVLPAERLLSGSTLKRRFPRVSWQPTRSSTRVDQKYLFQLERFWMDHVDKTRRETALDAARELLAAEIDDIS